MRIIRQVKEESPELASVRMLFREYEQELGENLCFQSFEEELKDPLKKYGPPKGILLLALWNFEPAGCIAVYPMEEEGVCEMKRLYVRPKHRSTGTGRTLVAMLLEMAKEIGYHTMRLDTLGKLQPAIKMYRQFGFRETGAYYDNPLPGVVYMEAMLR